MTSKKNEVAGMDDILPIFIYVVIKAAPKRIHSNLNFIQGFITDPNFLKFNEYAQSIQELRGAIEFIENLTY